MFNTFDFHYTQLRWVKSAMDQLPTFRPDGLTPAQVQAVITSGAAAKAAFQTQKATRDLAHAQAMAAVSNGHLAAVQVYPILKSRYRKDPASLAAINKLPVQDQTPADTRERLEAIAELWAQLPNPPGAAGPFVAWTGALPADTMDQDAFAALITTIATTDAALPGVDQQFQLVEAGLHQADDAMAELASAALIQGRGQFVVGTAAREVIDAIPTLPATLAPGAAVITTHTSPGPGQAHLVVAALHGTSFDWFRKGPGDASFALVEADVTGTLLDLSGLAAGAHQFKVLANNSVGTGPESAVVTVTVG